MKEVFRKKPSYGRLAKSMFSVIMSAVMLLSVLQIAVFAEGDDAEVPVYGTYATGAANWISLDTVMFGKDKGEEATVNISVDPSLKYQEYDGLGMSLEETSVANLWKLSKEVREETLRKVVVDWGIDLFRLVIGCCDCNEKHPFWSLDDTPNDQDDFGLEHFSIQTDIDQHIIETVKFIQSLNPDVKFFASAWSAPAWMKEIRYMDGNNGFVLNEDGSYKVMLNEDGTPMRRYRGWVGTNTYTLPSGATNTRTEQMAYLRDDCIDVFADYYVKYIQEYAKLGIPISAITILNEPGADVIYPAMNMTNEQHQRLALAIKSKFAENGINTQLWAHDWNVNDFYNNKSDAGKTINDPTEDNHYKVFYDSPSATREQMLEAYDAVALHTYDGGPPRLESDVSAHIGNLKIHQTETNEFGTNTILNWFNAGTSSYTVWVPFTDRNGGTHYWVNTKDNSYEFGVPQTGWRNRIATTRWDADPDYVTFTNNFYAWGQISKYLTTGDDLKGREGAVRIYSTGGTQSSVMNTTFLNPDGEIVMILRNGSNAERTVKVTLLDKSFVQTIPASSTTTLRWTPELPSGTDNHAPVLNDIAPITMGQYGSAEIQLEGSDADGNTFMYLADNLPSGVTLNSSTGLVTLNPQRSGTYNITFVVSDGMARSEKTLVLTVLPKGTPVGNRIEAELYNDMYGWTEGSNQFIENTSGASNGQNVGYTSAGNWLSFFVDIEEAGIYDVNFRASNGNASSSTDCIWLLDGNDNRLCSASVEATGSWTTYHTVSSKVYLEAGEQYVKLYCNKGGFNIDYFEFVKPATQIVTVPESANINEDFAFSAIVDQSYTAFRLYNENGRAVAIKDLAINYIDSVAQVDITTAVGTAGENRTLSLFAKVAGGSYVDTGVKITLDIIDIPAKVLTASFGAEFAPVNSPIELKVITNDLAKSIRIENENKRLMGKKLVSRNIVDEGIEWVYEISIGTKGDNRTFTVLASKGSSNYSDVTATASIDIV